MPSLSVVIPVYNEAATLVPHLQEVLRALEGWEAEWELVVVEDGSSDTTAELLRGMQGPRIRALYHSRNQGLDAALRTGISATDAEWVVTFDADLSYEPKLIVELIETGVARRAELVIASPYMPGGRVGQVPWLRLLLSRAANRLLHLASGIHCCTGMVRAYRRTGFALPEPGLDFNLDSLAVALERGATIVEIPACLDWRNPARGGRLSWTRLCLQVGRVLRAFRRFRRRA